MAHVSTVASSMKSDLGLDWRWDGAREEPMGKPQDSKKLYYFHLALDLSVEILALWCLIYDGWMSIGPSIKPYPEDQKRIFIIRVILDPSNCKRGPILTLAMKTSPAFDSFLQKLLSPPSLKLHPVSHQFHGVWKTGVLVELASTSANLYQIEFVNSFYCLDSKSKRKCIRACLGNRNSFLF